MTKFTSPQKVITGLCLEIVLNARLPLCVWDYHLLFGRRNIVPIILAHGIINTLGQTFRFLGIEDQIYR